LDEGKTFALGIREGDTFILHKMRKGVWRTVRNVDLKGG